MEETKPDPEDAVEDRDLYSGLMRLHILHHAAAGPVFGLGMVEELARHGYRISPGTLYPLLHGLEKKGYIGATSGATVSRCAGFTRLRRWGAERWRRRRSKCASSSGSFWRENSRAGEIMFPCGSLLGAGGLRSRCAGPNGAGRAHGCASGGGGAPVLSCDSRFAGTDERVRGGAFAWRRRRTCLAWTAWRRSTAPPGIRSMECCSRKAPYRAWTALRPITAALCGIAAWACW